MKEKQSNGIDFLRMLKYKYNMEVTNMKNIIIDEKSLFKVCLLIENNGNKLILQNKDLIEIVTYTNRVYKGIYHFCNDTHITLEITKDKVEHVRLDFIKKITVLT